MPKAIRLNLQRDQQTVRKFIERRIKDYPMYVNLGPGMDEDPISLLTVGFYAAQGGYVSLVCDTRIDAGPDRGFDGNWTHFLENELNMCWIPSWCDAFEALCEGRPVKLVRHDLIEVELQQPVPVAMANAFFGDMLVDLVMKLRNQGAFKKLPLAPKARIAVEEFDGYYFWPHPGKSGWPDSKTQAMICLLGQLE